MLLNCIDRANEALRRMEENSMEVKPQYIEAVLVALSGSDKNLARICNGSYELMHAWKKDTIMRLLRIIFTQQ